MAYKKAFTIVELLVVVIVIGILAIISLVSYGGITSKATVTSLSSDLNNASKQFKMFNIENNTYPNSVSDCPNPTAGNLCLKPSSDTSFQYYTNTGRQAFCLTATKSNTSYNLTQEGQALAGPCPSFNLDAGSNVSYPKSGTSWFDLSGNNTTATLFNHATYVSDNGGSMSFDGTDDYVSSGYVQGISSNQLAVSAWIKPGTVSGAHEISNQNQWDGGPWTGWRLRQNGNQINFKVSDNTSNNYDCTGGNLSAGNWYYVNGVWDGGYIRVYVNGTEVNNCSKSFTYVGNTGSHWIGKYAGTAYYFNGLISRVVVNRTALSASEILHNYNVIKGRYGL